MAKARELHPPSSILHPLPILLAGPTAVGKSELALWLAERLGGEIISVDSMQVYRELNIGTAKPSPTDRARVTHHLIDVVDLAEPFDAAKFAKLAHQAVSEIQLRGRVPVLCGGTGLYFRAFLEGLGDAPSSNAKVRAELEAIPLDGLLRELKESDPETFQRIDRRNPRRVIRAVEVIRLTGRPFSGQRANWNPASSIQHPPSPFFGLRRSADDLRACIDARVEQMFQQGLVEETRQLLERGLAQNKTAMQAIGYRQVVEHLRGERSLSETVELVKIRTRQFAKRQLTWFRRQAHLTWLELKPEEAAALAAARVAASLRLMLCGLLLAFMCGCTTRRHGQPLTYPARETPTMKVPFKIGNALVTAEVFQRGKPVPTMLNVHDDENTSVAAGKVVIEQTGGRLIELSHGGKRLVTFSLNGQRYSFDPNRIFSDDGIRNTLEKQSTCSEAGHRAVKRFATQYLEHFALHREPVIIALHNNTEGALSVESYRPGADYAKAAVAVHVAPSRSRDDFFYVTDQRFFDYLKQRDFNVVLQDNVNVPDDGSLSVYFARKGIPYVNIEAEISHLNAQIEMVRVAREMLDELRLL